MTKLHLLAAILLSTVFTTVLAQTKIEKHFYSGEYQTALKLINEKIENGKATPNDYNLAAKCNLQEFNYQKAIHDYQDGLLLFPDDAVLLEGLADAQVNLGFKAEALLSYNRLVAKDSVNTRYLGKQAGVLMDLDRYKQAKAIYQQLFDADSANVYFLRKLMMAKYKLKQYAYVIDLKTKNTYFPTKNKELQLLVADCYLKVNLNPEAIELLYTILNIDSLYIPAISKLAFVQFGTYRNYEDAVVLYRKLNALEEGTDLMHIRNLAICEYFVGRQEVAAPILQGLMNEVDDDPFIPFYAGLSYKKLGDADKALAYLERASYMIIPAYAGDFYHHLGRAYSAKRMFTEAIETYKKVQQYDPDKYQVLYDIAVCYDETLNRTVALGYYEQFVKKCDNLRSSDLKYAENRIRMIKEDLFFEGK